MRKPAVSPKGRKRTEAEESDATADKEPKKLNQSFDTLGGVSSSSPPHGSCTSDGATCRFPMKRVWRLIRGEYVGAADTEMRTTADSVFIINKASEMFLERFTEDAYAFAKTERKKTVNYSHLSSTVNQWKRYEFLSDFTPKKVRAEDALKARSLVEA